MNDPLPRIISTRTTTACFGLLGMLLAWCAASCHSPSFPPVDLGAWRGQSASDYTVTTEDYVGGGERLALARAQDNQFKGFFDRGKIRGALIRGVVRLFSMDLSETSISSMEGSFPAQASFRGNAEVGTGVLLYREGTWQVLTAGHVLPGPDDAGHTLLLVPGGNPIRLEALPRPSNLAPGRDLALLTIGQAQSLETHAAARLDELAVDPLVRRARRGEAVMILGFPGGNIGVTGQGAICTAAGPSAVSTDEVLEPIVVLAEVADTDPFELEFLAGIVPLAGMSGSPVYGLDGAILGVFTGVRSKPVGDQESLRGVSQPLVDFLATPESKPDKKASVLTESDYLKAGADGVERYLNEVLGQRGADMRRALETAASAIVEIKVRENIQGGFWSSSFSERKGSGLLAGSTGEILTAGHVVDNLAGKTEVHIFGAGWHTDQVEVLGVGYSEGQDWAHLHAEGIPVGEGLQSGSVALGDLVVSVGFPGGYGLDSNGNVRQRTTEKGLLEPIPIIARVTKTQPLELTLVAGAMPWGGASGSPVCNSSGEWVGVISGVATTIRGFGDASEVIQVSTPPSPAGSK